MNKADPQAKASILSGISCPQDMHALTMPQLKQLAEEVRAHMIDSVSQTGGHLGAGLGVVELSVALHHTFDSPRDSIIWDVGHQAYPHKILTGRADKMHTIRQPDGLSGFCRRVESEHDAFGAGHSSTSISAGLGMAVGRDLQQQKGDVIAVIGDGAMSAGMAYEALNNAGALGKRLIVILNDNDMSIAPAVGAMRNYLSRMVASSSYRSFRDMSKAITARLPEGVQRVAKRAETYARGMASGGGTLFGELGMYYIGPMDGHNLDHLVPLLRALRDDDDSHPLLIHVVTQKGKGFAPAENAADKYHGVVSFDAETGQQHKKKANAPAYTSVFARALLQEAAKDDKIVAITAAMPSGTGLDAFAEKYPERLFDVGIAEQHAVTFAAGLATTGIKPFVAIYSTFLQRAYDQIIHDVAIQQLPVRFAIDRAGLVGADGATHAGSFDIAYLACIPHMVLMAAADEAELMHMVATAAAYDAGAIAFRYPRGEGTGVALPEHGSVLAIGKGRILAEGTDVAILSYGTRAQAALEARIMLQEFGISATVADARFAKPLDTALITQLCHHHKLVVTLEEGSCGGFGAQVAHYCLQAGLLDTGSTKLRTLCLPDMFYEHGNVTQQYAECGLEAAQVAEFIRNNL